MSKKKCARRKHAESDPPPRATQFSFPGSSAVLLSFTALVGELGISQVQSVGGTTKRKKIPAGKRTQFFLLLILIQNESVLTTRQLLLFLTFLFLYTTNPTSHFTSLITSPQSYQSGTGTPAAMTATLLTKSNRRKRQKNKTKQNPESNEFLEEGKKHL